MKKKRLCAPLALLLGLALAAGCAGAPASSSEAPLREEDARIPGEGSGFVVQLEGEPPVSQQVRENTVTPGFIHMTEEYLRAREVFRLFRGNPSHVEDFPREDGTWYQPGTLSQEIDGKLYYRAWNRYENWADFEAMVRAVFTDEYADVSKPGRGALVRGGHCPARPGLSGRAYRQLSDRGPARGLQRGGELL